jgi:uncharacterized protein
MATPTPSADDITALIDGNGELRLRVIPGAKVERMAVENGALKIWLRTAPEDGKANMAIITTLATKLSMAADRINIVRGRASRDKVVRIA